MSKDNRIKRRDSFIYRRRQAFRHQVAFWDICLGILVVTLRVRVLF
jgi:hypothetical protein